MIRKVWNQVFTDTRTSWEGEESTWDKKTIWVMVTSAVCLMAINYLGKLDVLDQTLRALGMNKAAGWVMYQYRNAADPQLFRLGYWACCSFLFYAIVPAIIVRLIIKEKLKEYGARLGGAIRGYKIYILFFLIMLPLIWWMSHNQAFQSKYPFYDMETLHPNWNSFIKWEGFYLLQFVGLEFFFRGFMVHGTKHRFGFYSVFVMMVPYCMIHFGKPWQETTGAIMAGIALGALSLKSKSVWLGVAIHFSVAITMDLCALHQQGIFP